MISWEKIKSLLGFGSDTSFDPDVDEELDEMKVMDAEDPEDAEDWLEE